LTPSPDSPSVEPDWQAVAHDYSARILSVREICVLHDINLKQLYERIADEAWPRRRRLKRVAVRRVLASGANMPHRLLRALDMKMTELETYMATNTETSSPADFERNVRTLNTLAGLFEKLKKQAYLDQAGEQKGSGVDIGSAGSRDADTLRRELAERLQRLNHGAGLVAEDGQAVE
jgi:predicted DNA-binding transcriptional regulator AlpA